jgi:hypothetical protein
MRGWFWGLVLGLAVIPLGGSIALAQAAGLTEQALRRAVDQFEQALPGLDAGQFGVDLVAYRDALSLQRFSSSVWGGTITVSVQTQGSEDGQCARFAAFTRVPPENGVVPLVLCPRFFADGADQLRTLTILHEMVHVVAGTDECQAMAFAARVEQAATGRWTAVDRYWQASGCAGSAYRLPE